MMKENRDTRSAIASAKRARESARCAALQNADVPPLLPLLLACWQQHTRATRCLTHLSLSSSLSAREEEEEEDVGEEMIVALVHT